MVRKDKKPAYFRKLIDLVETVPKILIIGLDFVGSKQVQEIRMALRGKATMLCGKNTMIRTAFRQHMPENENLGLDKLITAVEGNCAFIFCEGDVDEIRKIVTENKISASAKAGIVAQCDVTIPAGGTGMDPSQTSFFQTLNIPTKVVKGAIEIVAEQRVCKAGVKVSATEAALLAKMGLKPFSYGCTVNHVYDHGSVFSAKVLDITDDVLISQFITGVRNIAALSREVGVPTEAAVPHMISNALKNMASLCAEIDYNFPEIEKLKEFLADPEAFASAAAAAAPAAAAGGGGKAAAPAAAAAVEEEEEDMDFDLFG